MIPAAGDPLAALLDRARAAGFLGPGSIERQWTHAEGFAAVVERALGQAPAAAADLGTGGGVPGLVLAWRWPETPIVLFEAMTRRAVALAAAIVELGWESRVRVRHGRAEVAGHEADLREHFDVVTARGFDRPPITAEIAAGLVCSGGIVVVSEPPGGDPTRWPAQALRELGLGPAEIQTVTGTGGEDTSFAILPKVAATPADRPRSTKALVKRPAW